MLHLGHTEETIAVSCRRKKGLLSRFVSGLLPTTSTQPTEEPTRQVDCVVVMMGKLQVEGCGE